MEKLQAHRLASFFIGNHVLLPTKRRLLTQDALEVKRVLLCLSASARVHLLRRGCRHRWPRSEWPVHCSHLHKRLPYRNLLIACRGCVSLRDRKGAAWLKPWRGLGLQWGAWHGLPIG